MLVADPLSYQVARERITLDIITQSILYTDARRGIMQQRSGGLASTKNLTQKLKTKNQLVAHTLARMNRMARTLTRMTRWLAH